MSSEEQSGMDTGAAAAVMHRLMAPTFGQSDTSSQNVFLGV